MKLLILYEATIEDIERRIPVFLKQYFGGDESKESLDIIRQLAELDPTKGKYTEWVLRQYKKEAIRVPEDNDNIAKNLAKFHKVKGKLENKDINSYTPGLLARALEPHGEESKRQTKKLGRKGQLVLPPGAGVVLEKGKYKVVKITDVKASTILCSGTEWCTANSEPAQEYLDDGPLYIIYEDGERKYLIHYEADQFMDVYNEEINQELKWQLMDLLAPATGKSRHTDPEVAYTYAEQVIKGRWPDGESAIAKSAKAAYKYASHIIKGRWPEAEPVMAKNADVALSYARNIIEGRWPEGEPAIMKAPDEAAGYAETIIKGRWPEAEPFIMKGPRAAVYYAQHLGLDRWPEAEPYIIKDLFWAVMYAEQVIKGRWPEAESAVAKDPDRASSYAISVIKGRWPEAEPVIAKDASEAYTYAKQIIGGRWPDGESVIMKDVAGDDPTAVHYAANIIKGRWPEAEPYIMKDATAAVDYAQSVIGGRWPEAEPYIMKDARAAEVYSHIKERSHMSMAQRDEEDRIAGEELWQDLMNRPGLTHHRA